MNLRRIWAVFRREYLFIGRDPRSVFLTFALPVLALCLNAFSLKNETGPLKLGVLDSDGTALSRRFLTSLADDSLFHLRVAASPHELAEWVQEGKVSGALRLGKNFSFDLLRGEDTWVDFGLNAADPNSARSYLMDWEVARTQFPVDWLEDSGALKKEESEGLPYHLRLDILYNPRLRRLSFFIPALLGCILMSIVPLLSAISIVREREEGSFNRLLASPTTPLEFLLGKTSAFFLIALLQFSLLVALGIWGFETPFHGSFAWLFLVAAIFCLWTVLFGLTFSTFCQSQITALIAGVVFTLLPAFIFSGLFFPITAIPWPIRGIAYLIPTSYFSTIARGIFLKGSAFNEWQASFVGLCLVTLGTFFLMYGRFKKIARGPS